MDIRQFNVILQGSPSGPYSIQIPLHTTSVYVVPRKYVIEARSIEGIYRPGVYILFGNGKIYIGQTRNGLTRIEQHLSSKDFWEKAILFLSDNTQFDLDMISGLEKVGIERAFNNSPYEVVNKDRPNYEAKSAYNKLLINSCYDEIEAMLNFLGIETKKEIGPDSEVDIPDAKPEGDGWTNIYSCGSLKGKKLERYIFQGKEYTDKNFTELYVDIWGKCYDIDPEAIHAIGGKSQVADNPEALQKDWMNGSIAGREFRPHLFVNTWHDTDTKMKILKKLMDYCNLPHDALMIKLI